MRPDHPCKTSPVIKFTAGLQLHVCFSLHKVIKHKCQRIEMDVKRYLAIGRHQVVFLTLHPEDGI